MGMLPFCLIMLSNGLSVSWNTLAKKSSMTVAFYAIVCLASNLLWWHVLAWTPLPIAQFPARFWMYVALSVAFDFCYCFGMVGTYRRMDMSAAYPVMRAMPILLTAAITAVFGVGKALTPQAILGIIVISVGCLVIPLPRFSDFKVRNFCTWGMFFLFFNALGSSGYTVADSLAQKELLGLAAPLGVGKPVVSMTFYVFRGMLLATSMTVYVLLRRTERRAWLDFFRTRNATPALAGLFSSMTYILILVATNYVDNVSYIQIFRQFSMVFSMVAGVLFLKEKCTATKLTGLALILSGMLLTIVG